MTREDLAAELRRRGWRWHLWEGVSGIRYGRRKDTTPPVVVRGAEWGTVLEQIKLDEASR